MKEVITDVVNRFENCKQTWFVEPVTIFDQEKLQSKPKPNLIYIHNGEYILGKYIKSTASINGIDRVYINTDVKDLAMDPAAHIMICDPKDLFFAVELFQPTGKKAIDTSIEEPPVVKTSTPNIKAKKSFDHLKTGDTVKVTYVGTVNRREDGIAINRYNEACDGASSVIFYNQQADVVDIEVLEPKYDVGDQVTVDGFNGVCEVWAIRGDVVWVQPLRSATDSFGHIFHKSRIHPVSIAPVSLKVDDMVEYESDNQDTMDQYLDMKQKLQQVREVLEKTRAIVACCSASGFTVKNYLNELYDNQQNLTQALELLKNL